MNGADRIRTGVPAGLCGHCRHARTVRSDRGSVFILCGRSRSDPRYARYPRLPVSRCPGYEPRGTGRDDPRASAPAAGDAPRASGTEGRGSSAGAGEEASSP